MTAMVFVWNPKPSVDADYGHASMYAYADNATKVYISWWPEGTIWPAFGDFCAPAYGTQGLSPRTFERDCLDEGSRTTDPKPRKSRKPEFSRKIPELDDEKVVGYWQALLQNKDAAWCGFALNCADVVYQALLAGGAEKAKNPPHGKFGPQMLKTYVIELLKKQEKKLQKVK